MLNRKLLKQLILLSSLSIINNKVKAENQCLSNLDCAKYNTDTDTHVCIRYDGQTDYACYSSSVAYCDSDATCQGINPSLKYCYVPPWITNKNSQKQCFTVHEVGGSCVEDYHCTDGFVCSDNVCVVDISGPSGAAVIKSNAVANSDTNTNTSANTNTNTNTNSNADADADNNTDTTTSKSTDSNVKSTNSTSTTTEKTGTKGKTGSSKSSSSNKSSNSTSTLDLDDYDDEKKDKPIEILGLPLWAFILLATIPVIFLIAVLWGLAIGRKSYREEEERKKGRMALKNSKKDMEINYKGASTENLLSQSTSDLSLKDDMLKNYLQGDKKKTREAVPSTVSSNSTIGNNLTAVTVESKSKTSPHLEVPKTRKPRKSNASSTSNSDINIPPKPKKPKSIVNSDFSDTNSYKGLLAAGQPMGMSAAESGIYSSYFGGGASTVSSSYFQQPMGVPQPDPAMTALYYQQYMAAQAQQAAAAQQYMAQYYIDRGMGMPTVDMMQYQQMYGMGMAYPGTEASASASETKKTKHKGGK
jgi:hypothetical protein